MPKPVKPKPEPKPEAVPGDEVAARYRHCAICGLATTKTTCPIDGAKL